jgi:hypothetical protein
MAEKFQQWDATMRVVVRSDTPLTLDEIRERLVDADEFELDVDIPHVRRENLTVTAGTVHTETMSPFSE